MNEHEHSVKDRLQLYLDAANHAMRQGAYSAAEKLYIKSLQHAELLGKYHPDLIQTIDTVASFYEKTNKLNNAEQLYRRALLLTHRQHSNDHPLIIAAINNLSYILITLESYDEAEQLLEHALDILNKYPGSMESQRIETLCNRSALLLGQEKYTEAESRLTQALRHAEVVMGENHPTVACIMKQYADLLKRSKRYVESEVAHLNASQLIRHFKIKADPPAVCTTPAYAVG